MEPICQEQRGKRIKHSTRFRSGAQQLVEQSGHKKSRSNLTDRAVERISHSENGTTEIAGGVDQDIKRIRSSGQHTSSSTERDLDELVK